MEEDDIAAEIVVQYLEEIECARHVGRGDLKGEMVNLAITNSPYKTTEIWTQRPHAELRYQDGLVKRWKLCGPTRNTTKAWNLEDG